MYLNYYKIFISTLKLAFLSFGGGSATISLIKDEFVKKNKFISESDFEEIVILANTLPGPTMTQIITYISYSYMGFGGFIISFITLLFPGSLILGVLITFAKLHLDTSYLKAFSKGVMPCVIAMLSVFAYDMLNKDIGKKNVYNYYLYASIFVLTLILLIFKINIAFIFFGIIILIVLIYHLLGLKKWTS